MILKEYQKADAGDGPQLPGTACDVAGEGQGGAKPGPRLGIRLGGAGVEHDCGRAALPLPPQRTR